MTKRTTITLPSELEEELRDLAYMRRQTQREVHLAALAIGLRELRDPNRKSVTFTPGPEKPRPSPPKRKR